MWQEAVQRLARLSHELQQQCLIGKGLHLHASIPGERYGKKFAMDGKVESVDYCTSELAALALMSFRLRQRGVEFDIHPHCEANCEARAHRAQRVRLKVLARPLLASSCCRVAGLLILAACHELFQRLRRLRTALLEWPL